MYSIGSFSLQLDILLQNELQKRPKYAPQIHAIKTRMSARRLLVIIKQEVLYTLILINKKS